MGSAREQLNQTQTTIPSSQIKLIKDGAKQKNLVEVHNEKKVDLSRTQKYPQGSLKTNAMFNETSKADQSLHSNSSAGGFSVKKSVQPH
jgi:hypothetical protein